MIRHGLTLRRYCSLKLNDHYRLQSRELSACAPTLFVRSTVNIIIIFFCSCPLCGGGKILASRIMVSSKAYLFFPLRSWYCDSLSLFLIFIQYVKHRSPLFLFFFSCTQFVDLDGRRSEWLVSPEREILRVETVQKRYSCRVKYPLLFHFLPKSSGWLSLLIHTYK